MASLMAAQSTRTGAQQQLTAMQGQAAALEGQIADVEVDIEDDGDESDQVVPGLAGMLEPKAATATDESVPDTVPWCAIAGVFGDQSAAADFVSGLVGLGVEGLVQMRTEQVSSTWWVHMPAFASEAAAMALLAELQEKNIDSYYMRSGEMAGGISLGVFSRQESAAIAQRQLAERGYDTSVREVARMGERHYVALRMPDGTLRQAPEWTAFLGRVGRIEVLDNACEKIASENEFP
ncbi:MAG: hypothetical protein RLZZ227_2520 [Pseudomonadota bacterium]